MLVIMLLIIVVINGMINYRDGLVLHARRSTMASVNTVTFQWMKLSDTTEFIVRSVAVDSRQFPNKSSRICRNYDNSLFV